MQPSSINTLIGQNIHRRRRALSLTQEAVGAYLGVSFQQVQKYEKGTNALSCEKLLRLAGLLRCSIVDLVPTAPEMPGARVANPHEACDGDPLMLQIGSIPSFALRKTLVDMVRLIATVAATPHIREP